jgi:hypothetical protein
MTKLNRKHAATLSLLLVVTLAPTSIAFAQTTSDTEEATDTKNKRADKKDEIKTRLADKEEKRIDRIKDEVRTKVRDVKTDDADRGTNLTFRGNTDGWAIIGGKATKSSLVLGGNAHHVGGGNWKITSDGDLTVADRHAKLSISGHARGNMINLQGSGTLDSGENFRVSLKGYFAPTNEKNVYAIAFTHTNVQYTNSGIRVPLMHVGSVTIVETIPSVPVEEIPATQ